MEAVTPNMKTHPRLCSCELYASFYLVQKHLPMQAGSTSRQVSTRLLYRNWNG